MKTINKLALIALVGSLAGYGIQVIASNYSTASDTISHTGQGTATEPCGSGTTLDCAIKRARADALAQLVEYCPDYKRDHGDCELDCDPDPFLYADLDESTVTYEVLKRTALSGGGVKVTVKATGKCYCVCQKDAL